MEKYVDLHLSSAMKEKKLHRIMGQFINQERNRQEALEWLENLSTRSKKKPKDGTCTKSQLRPAQVNHQQGETGLIAFGVCGQVYWWQKQGRREVTSTRLFACIQFNRHPAESRQRQFCSMKDVLCVWTGLPPTNLIAIKKRNRLIDPDGAWLLDLMDSSAWG